MELIVLNVGLDLGVISSTLFAMLVIMAIATTVALHDLTEASERAGMAQAFRRTDSDALSKQPVLSGSIAGPGTQETARGQDPI